MGEVVMIANHAPTGSLTRAAARALTDEVKADAAELWIKMLRLYEGDAHKALGYSSWGAYCEAEFEMGRDYSYRLLRAARVAEALSELTIVNSPPSEGVARELVPLLDEPERLRKVWEEVVEKYEQPTAAQIREQLRAQPESAPPEDDAPDTPPGGKFEFITELKIQYVAPNQAAADLWIQRLVERIERNGPSAFCKHIRTRGA